MTNDSAELLGHLNGERNYLVVLDIEDMQHNINQLIDFLINKRQWTCTYLTLNKPYEAIKKNLESKGYDLKKFFFIDAVGGSQEKNLANVKFIPSSSALTQIDIFLTQMTQFIQSQGFILIDTLEGLMINNEPKVIANFLKSVVRKSTKYNSKVIVLSSGGGEERFIKLIAPFFDKVITINKKKLSESIKNNQ